MDGLVNLENVLVVGMTNRKELLDEALLRPGRMEVTPHPTTLRFTSGWEYSRIQKYVVYYMLYAGIPRFVFTKKQRNTNNLHYFTILPRLP